MSLKLNQQGEGIIFTTGEKVIQENGVVLFGMSPGNPYFKPHVIQQYVEFLGKDERRVMVVVPQQPAEHTYRAMGSKNAVKRAKRNASQLTLRCRRAIERVSSCRELPGSFHIIDWSRDVDTHIAYVQTLEMVLQFYRTNKFFRQDAIRMTAKVLGKHSTNETSDRESDFYSDLEKDANIKEGVLYPLKELALILSSKSIFSVDEVSVIYYRNWPLYEKYINGDYDGQPKPGYGLSIIH